jgi:hypothetical protein
MTEDLNEHFIEVAQQEVDQLPYELDTGTEDLLKQWVEQGVERMQQEGRTSPADMSEADENLRAMLNAAEQRVALRSSGEGVLLPEGLMDIAPLGGWWPFS